ncbi:hypothetical protein RI367_006120 [Sorochytrium milnesiophthora]
MRVKPSRYSTARGLIRMSWSKYNLYNLAERRNYPDLARRTLFQQMWQAKKEARAYHGGNMTERQFKSTWAREPLPVYGAANTGTTASSGDAARRLPPMQTLTFAEVERRLDVVLFRSCFAPSVYAARQMVSSGKVTLNGQKCKQPSYLMRDGDMLSVQPSAIPMLHMPTTAEGEKGKDNNDKKDATGGLTKLQRLARQTFAFKARPYQHPWMFIPEYLEVDFKTCSTVFVRAPMVKPGRCEIPSPFPPEVHGLAHEWYSKRTKLSSA